MATEFFKMIETSKQNIVANWKTLHFGSQGYIVSIGNKALFKMPNQHSSIGQYAYKILSKPQHQNKIDKMAGYVDYICYQQVKEAAPRISKVVNKQSPGTILPILRTGAYDLQRVWWHKLKVCSFKQAWLMAFREVYQYCNQNLPY